MYLYERDPDRRQRIPQGYAGVGKRGRIDHDEIHAGLTGFVYSFYQLGLGIALETVQFDSGIDRLGSQSPADVRQRFPPVYLRLPGAEKIQVGTMQNQNLPESSRRGRPRFAALRGGSHSGQFAAVTRILSRFTRN
jgi:hypothetical protein